MSIKSQVEVVHVIDGWALFFDVQRFFDGECEVVRGGVDDFKISPVDVVILCNGVISDVREFLIVCQSFEVFRFPFDESAFGFADVE